MLYLGYHDVYVHLHEFLDLGRPYVGVEWDWLVFRHPQLSESYCRLLQALKSREGFWAFRVHRYSRLTLLIAFGVGVVQDHQLLQYS